MGWVEEAAGFSGRRSSEVWFLVAEEGSGKFMTVFVPAGVCWTQRLALWAHRSLSLSFDLVCWRRSCSELHIQPLPQPPPPPPPPGELGLSTALK